MALVTHPFTVVSENPPGTRVALTSAKVYVIRVSDLVEVYGTAAAKILIPQLSVGYHGLVSPAVFTGGIAYRSIYEITKTNGTIVRPESEWIAQNPTAPGAVSTIWTYAGWELESGYAAQRVMLIQHRSEVRARMSGAHAGDGHSYDPDTLNRYLENLDKQLERLDELTGDASPTRSLATFQGA